MRRVALLYNPRSGKGNHVVRIERIAEALRDQRCDVTIEATRAAGTAGEQARVLADAHDVVFACGGDGTLHDVLQGMVRHPTCALGVIPTGSANVMARHLGLNDGAVRAARQQLAWKPRLIPLGHVSYATRDGEGSRYFLSLAGAGPDGALMYKMLAAQKQSFGRVSYYFSAVSLFLRRGFAAFDVTVHGQRYRAVSALTTRVGSMGGLFDPLVPKSRPDDATLTVTLIDAPAQITLPAWFAMSWARMGHLNRYARSVKAEEFCCEAPPHGRVEVQADGEHLGQTPMRVRLETDALRMLMPD